ncbi:hypothetical protein [Actinoplanes flavus]|uniref:Uncharacterized protein n=1 Tax=Actinoplanes flavus TaxID=2820290 RepID=A0ABS3UGT0_9ACTN|nr:hypothetical protein [Actinoplanes flavus]MBO3737977.1 hypothetical protein [Actinoplanes flavus]
MDQPLDRMIRATLPYRRERAAHLGWGLNLDEPERMRGELVLLLGRWDPGRLRDLLTSIRMLTPARTPLGGAMNPLWEIIDHLWRLGLPPTEFESWLRWVYGGNLAEMTEHWWMPHLRLLHPDGTAAREAARALGITEPADRLVYRWVERTWRPPLFPVQHLIPRDMSHLTALFADDPLPITPGISYEVAALLAHGWTPEQVRREARTGPPHGLDGMYRRLVALRYIPARAFDGWRDVLTPAGASAHERLRRLYAAPALRQLVAVWEATRIPAVLQPWCAGAGLTPEEAVEMNARGALDLETLRTLTALHR